MKQHFGKSCFFVFFTLLLVGCDAGEQYIKEQNDNVPIIKTLTYNQADETFNRLKRELKIEKNLKPPKSLNLQARTVKDTFGFAIETDIIKQVTLGDYKSYTMKLVEQENSIIFYNLTIEDKNGVSSMFITQYIPTEYRLN